MCSPADAVDGKALREDSNMEGEMFERTTTSPVDPAGESAAEIVPAAITDTGCERDLNEDRYAVIDNPSGTCWIVCDGMGGASGGELAAQLVIDAMRRDLEGAPQRPAAEALRSALIESNRIIVLRRQNPAFSAMGTTIVSAFFSGAEVVIGSAGDSRAYLVRNGVIQQLTTDHTYVQDLVNKGQIRPDEALTHPQAHVLTKAIGSEPSLDFDVKSFWVWQVAEDEPRDFLVLATDGLYSLVTESEITDLVSNSSPQQACSDLVERAKSRGGFDNITIAVIPLTGQLKSEPPIGYQRPARRQGAVTGETIESPLLSIPFLLLAVVCVGIVVLLTVIGFGFYLVK